MSGQHHVLVNLPPGKKKPIAAEYESGRAQQLVWTFWRTEKSIPRPGFGPVIFQSVAYSLYRLHYIFKHVCIYNLMTQIYVLGNSHVL